MRKPYLMWCAGRAESGEQTVSRRLAGQSFGKDHGPFLDIRATAANLIDSDILSIEGMEMPGQKLVVLDYINRV